ncbi:hypothetical protein OR983_33705 [Burkholderia ambifaria]
MTEKVGTFRRREVEQAGAAQRRGVAAPATPNNTLPDQHGRAP